MCLESAHYNSFPFWFRCSNWWPTVATSSIKNFKFCKRRRILVGNNDKVNNDNNNNNKDRVTFSSLLKLGLKLMARKFFTRFAFGMFRTCVEWNFLWRQLKQWWSKRQKRYKKYRTQKIYYNLVWDTEFFKRHLVKRIILLVHRN